MKFENESQFQSAADEFLRKRGVLFRHDEKGRGRNRTHRGGWPDLQLFLHGQTVFIELKQEKGRLRESQIVRMLELGNMGFKCYVAHDWNEFVSIMGLIGIE